MFDPGAEPLGRIEAAVDAGAEGGIGPLGRLGNMAVLGRVGMDVVGMRRMVGGAADRVLPEAALPDAPFPAAAADLGQPTSQTHHSTGADESERTKPQVLAGGSGSVYGFRATCFAPSGSSSQSSFSSHQI